VYRRRVRPEGLVSFSLSVAQSDLLISACSDLSAQAAEALRDARNQIELYAGARAGFLESLDPLPPDPQAPPVVARMIEAGRLAGVGPMAAVAGAVAGAVGRALMPASPEVIVENGGDLFVACSRPRVCALFAGESGLSMRLGIRLPPALRSLGLCTSSGTVGPSMSRGRADAAAVLSADECLADAAATALGNRIESARDLAAAIDWIASIEGVAGALAVAGEDLAVWGNVELVEI
jgi:ApbE superfamily uncharacterized protein (UPF0280 family)